MSTKIVTLILPQEGMDLLLEYVEMLEEMGISVSSALEKAGGYYSIVIPHEALKRLLSIAKDGYTLLP